jgi:hypothetical protein
MLALICTGTEGPQAVIMETKKNAHIPIRHKLVHFLFAIFISTSSFLSIDLVAALMSAASDSH